MNLLKPCVGTTFGRKCSFVPQGTSAVKAKQLVASAVLRTSCLRHSKFRLKRGTEGLKKYAKFGYCSCYAVKACVATTCKAISKAISVPQVPSGVRKKHATRFKEGLQKYGHKFTNLVLGDA